MRAAAAARADALAAAAAAGDRPVFLAPAGGMGALVDALARPRSATASAPARRWPRSRRSTPTRRGRPVAARPGRDRGRRRGGGHARVRGGAPRRRRTPRWPARSSAAIEHASVALVGLVVPREAVDRELDGSGYLVPRSAGRLLTACSWVSTKWAHQAGDGSTVVLRASAGHARDDRALRMDDDALVAAMLHDLGDTMALHGDPSAVRVNRWPRSFPQPRPGHLDDVAAAEADLAAHAPGLAATGAWARGVGIPACIKGGRAAAARLLADRGRLSPAREARAIARAGAGRYNGRYAQGGRTRAHGGRGAGRGGGRARRRRLHGGGRRPRAARRGPGAARTTPHRTSTSAPARPRPGHDRRRPRPPRRPSCRSPSRSRPTTTPPRPRSHLGTLSLPSIGVTAPLGEGVTLTAVDRGPGHWPGTAMPGQVGNVVVAGHRVTHTPAVLRPRPAGARRPAGLHPRRRRHVDLPPRPHRGRGDNAIHIVDQTPGPHRHALRLPPQGLGGPADRRPLHPRGARSLGRIAPRSPGARSSPGHAATTRDQRRRRRHRRGDGGRPPAVGLVAAGVRGAGGVRPPHRRAGHRHPLPPGDARRPRAVRALAVLARRHDDARLRDRRRRLRRPVGRGRHDRALRRPRPLGGAARRGGRGRAAALVVALRRGAAVEPGGRPGGRPAGARAAGRRHAAAGRGDRGRRRGHRRAGRPALEGGRGRRPGRGGRRRLRGRRAPGPSGRHDRRRPRAGRRQAGHAGQRHRRAQGVRAAPGRQRAGGDPGRPRRLARGRRRHRGPRGRQRRGRRAVGPGAGARRPGHRRRGRGRRPRDTSATPRSCSTPTARSATATTRSTGCPSASTCRCGRCSSRSAGRT